MKAEKKIRKKKWTLKQVALYLLLLLFIAFSIVSIYAYNNFNKIITEAVYSNFNSNIISNVYELKFKKLRLSILNGTIKITNVILQPREKPLLDYPYINSSFSLKTSKILLQNIDLIKLFKEKKVIIQNIEIINPEIALKMSGEKIEFFPYKDSTIIAANNPKKKLDSFNLNRFNLINASIHSENLYKKREFNLDSLNISFRELIFSQDTAGIQLFFKKAELGIARFKSNLENDKIRNLNFSGFNVGLDSINIQKTPDTLNYHFKNCAIDVKDFEIQTADSAFALAFKSFNLSFAKKTLQINGFSLIPDIKKVSKLEKYKYQLPPIVAVETGDIKFTGLNFDTLVYRKKLFVDELTIDSLHASIFKDKSKPINLKRIAEYPGQKIKKLKLPVMVKKVTATNVSVDNDELKPDGTHAKVKVYNINADINNYTNIDSINPMILKGSGSIENKAFFNIYLAFSYQLSQFSFNGNIKKFDLTDLNPLLKQYAPVNINKGVVDEISFSGTANKTSSTGTLTFLYHNLDIDLQLKERAKWQSELLTFAANSYVNNANPVKENQPPRVVKYHATRDINKGFLNMVLKSFFAGLKETIILSKENRESYKEDKNQSKKNKK